MKRLIVTGDDFGLSRPVNEAIERAHRDAILTTASLLVGASAAADAVERARRLPTLRVGLHLALVRARPLLPPAALPDLVDTRGNLPVNLARAGVRIFFSPAVRRQAETEIRAQFEAFRATGLPLDHVNAHNHMHLHPTILSLILKVGRDYDLRAMRVPAEPFLPSWRASRSGMLARLGGWLFLAPWVRLMARRVRRANLECNDRLFGLRDTGRMTEERVLALVGQLPEGVTEIYFHPATHRWQEIPWPTHYACEAEFAALTSPAVRAALLAAGIPRIAFTDLLVARR